MDIFIHNTLSGGITSVEIPYVETLNELEETLPVDEKMWDIDPKTDFPLCSGDTVRILPSTQAKLASMGIEVSKIAFLSSADVEHTNLLLKTGIDINVTDEQGSTALMLAARHSHPDIVEFLLGEQAFIDIENRHDNTALILASYAGCTEAVKLLLQAGASVNVKNKSCITALMMASWYGHADIVKLLIEKGASVNLMTSGGYTAVSLAAKYGYIEVIKLLNDADADEFMHRPQALIDAARFNQIGLVRYLLTTDISRDTKNNLGKTALDMAVLYDRSEIIELLRNADAR